MLSQGNYAHGCGELNKCILFKRAWMKPRHWSSSSLILPQLTTLILLSSQLNITQSLKLIEHKLCSVLMGESAAATWANSLPWGVRSSVVWGEGEIEVTWLPNWKTHKHWHAGWCSTLLYYRDLQRIIETPEKVDVPTDTHASLPILPFLVWRWNTHSSCI